MSVCLFQLVHLQSMHTSHMEYFNDAFWSFLEVDSKNHYPLWLYGKKVAWRASSSFWSHFVFHVKKIGLEWRASVNNGLSELYCVLAANATQISKTEMLLFSQVEKVFSKKSTFKCLWCYNGHSLWVLRRYCEYNTSSVFFLEGKVSFEVPTLSPPSRVDKAPLS